MPREKHEENRRRKSYEKDDERRRRRKKHRRRKTKPAESENNAEEPNFLQSMVQAFVYNENPDPEEPERLIENVPEPKEKKNKAKDSPKPSCLKKLKNHLWYIILAIVIL